MTSKIKKIGFLVILGIIIALLTVSNNNFSEDQGNNIRNVENRNDTNLKTSNSEITIVSPEDTTYGKPMSGYYPATYGFENDEDGSLPNEWIEAGDGSYQGKTTIINSKDGHNKIMRIHDDSGGGGGDRITARQDFNAEQASGTLELWIYFDSDPGDATDIRIENSLGTLLTIISAHDNEWRYINGTSWVMTGLSAINEWFHLSIDFCSAGTYKGLSSKTYKFTIHKSDGSIYYESPKVDYSDYTIGNGARITITSWQTAQRDTWVDAVGYSWDPNYNIGDNFYEGLLLRFHHNINPEWIGYSLDGQANKTILGNITISMPVDGFHSIQIFDIEAGITYKSVIRNFVVNIFNIITPENKAYSKPMNGYYPATYGFENDIIGSSPAGWKDLSASPDHVEVIAEKAGHNNVIKLNDTSFTSGCSIRNEFPGKDTGLIEFWFLTENISQWTYISLRNSLNDIAYFLRVESGYLKIWYNDPLTSVDIPITEDKWYHIKTSFDCNLNKASVWINGDLKLDSGDFYITVSTIDRLIFHTDVVNYGNYVSYFDAVGYSWDLNYKIGNNLKEGLLLSFNCEIELDYIAYSLDDQEHVPILGNVVIPMPSDGTHTIQVFGDVYTSQVRHFTIGKRTLTPPPPDDDDDDDGEEEIEFLGPTLIIIGITSAIAVAGVAIYLIRKRRSLRE